MLDDVSEFLDGESDYLMAQSGPDFLRQLAAYLGALKSEPRIAAMRGDLVHELDAIGEAYAAHDEALVPQAVELRNEFVKLAPDADDSGTERPGPRHADSLFWLRTLSGFDAIVEGGPPARFPVDPTGAEDRSRSGNLLGILREKIHALQHTRESTDGTTEYVEENQRPELDDLGRRVGRLLAEHTKVHQDFVNKHRAHPGGAFLGLEGAVEDLNPEPPPMDESPDETAYRLSTLLQKSSTLVLLRDALYNTGSQGLSAEKESQLTQLIDEQLRPRVERLHHGLRGLAWRRRSYERLLLRFKARCELHTADSLRARVEANTRKAETRLTEAAAAFFFDQGLNPLTETVVAKLRTDLLDPFAGPTLYIESKQVHEDTKDPAGEIREGAWQLYNTLRRMKSEPFAAREAFLLVFRRGGPDIELPDPYKAEDWTIYPMLIDIAPTELSGSRQKRAPIKLTVEGLAPQPASDEPVGDKPETVRAGP